MKVEFKAVPGKPLSGTLVLSNTASVKVRVRAELLDFYVDENTTPQFVAHAPQESEYSCRAWLSANPMELEMEPNSQVPVRYSVRIPANATERGYHCALGFRTLPPVMETTGSTMVTAVRMITVFYPTLGNPPVVGVVKNLTLERISGTSEDRWRAVALLENSGDILYRPIGNVDILDASGNVVETLPLATHPSLPKRQQRYVLPIKSTLTPGPYTLRARVEIGGEIQEASVAVTAEAAPAQQGALAR